MALGISGVFLLAGVLQPVGVWGAPVTTITVDSSEDDYNDGYSKTCLNSSPCTLRRAINQAYSLTSDKRPVLIRFNIPTSDPGYINSPEVPGAWKIQLTGSTSSALRDLNGQVTINGSTQPGGRTQGPKIIIDGQNSKNTGFVLRYTDNVVRGVAMQNFKTHISVSGDKNTVMSNWFGLSDDGRYLSAGDEVTPEGGSGVVVSNVDDNVIRGNVFAGFFGTASSITGDNNVFAGNKVGTRADGTIPLPSGYTKHPCLYSTWEGGVGITVAGTGNRIGGPAEADRNLFAGLFLSLSETATQSPAIKIYSGSNHIIQNNFIGVDAKGKEVGVCGRGLDLGSGPDYLKVLNNTFAETGLSSILMNSSVEGNTIQWNKIERSSPWPGEQPGNDFAEGPIAYGPTVPSYLENFVPAAVTSISGNTVKGTSGAGSPCPDCVIELFLDDVDQVKECRKPLKRVTADANGNWTATLAAPLAFNQGLRTMSTVPDALTIIGLKQGTTSNISELYRIPKVKVQASDPTASEPGTNVGVFTFTRDADFGPLTVYYSVAGNATAGADYYALSGQVVFPEGVSTKTVQVKPKNDTTKEGDETVKVILLDKPAYNLGTPAQAVVTIKDND
jgi:hypothetical protein